MTLEMRNLLTSTTSVGNVVCILDLLESIVPDLQRASHLTYAIQPIVQLTTALQFFATGQLAASSASVEISMAFKKSSVSRCIGAVSKRNGLLFSTSSRRTATSSPVQFSFFIFKVADILCILLYTSIISLHVIEHVVFCGHLWPL